MNRRNAVRVKKISIVLSALLMLLLLCGCRTRVTNNTDVTNTLEDGGMMQETYQIRRDELGIPVAESPLFKGWESADDEYDEYGDYYEEFDTYEDEPYEDEEEEIEHEEESRNPETNPVNRQQHQPVRPPIRTTAGDIKVTLDVNAKDAKCNQTFIMVKKGSTYGGLPAATRSGYELVGWYTAKKDGDKVTSKTKVTKEQPHTLYAHWKKETKEDKKEEEDPKKEEEPQTEPEPQPEPQPQPQPQPEQKTYTITFDGNGGGDSVELSSSQMTVEENGSYGSMPSAKRNKYSFAGWYTDPSGGEQITGGSKFTANADQTLYAHWSFEPYTWWDNSFKEAANNIKDEDRVVCAVEDGDDDEKDFVKSCKGMMDKDNPPDYVIKFINFDNYDEESLTELAQGICDSYSESNPEVKVILISNKAYKGKEKNQLLYKMKLFDALYGGTGETEEALADLIDDDTTIYDLFIYP